MIAFFGMGLLGSNFVRAFRRREETVHVWNRTASRADALAEVGAIPFATPAAAAEGATFVHLTLKDDEAVDSVLEAARPGFSKHVTIIDHTTTSAPGAKERAKRWADRGIAFQHAPVFMGPQNALEGTGVMMVSGDRTRVDRLSPHLAKMTGKLAYVGEAEERAAGMKLLGNLFLITMTTGLSDMFGLAKALGISPTDASGLFDVFNPGVTLAPRAKRMLEGNFSSPSWELAMARKDARLMMEEAERSGIALAALPGIVREFDRWIESGHATFDWTIISRDFIHGAG